MTFEPMGAVRREAVSLVASHGGRPGAGRPTGRRIRNLFRAGMNGGLPFIRPAWGSAFGVPLPFLYIRGADGPGSN